MKPNIILMNFTHVYEEENFIKNRRFRWIDCTDLNGVDCYCDVDARRRLEEKIASFSPEGIHFIDSGNYHYLSKLWTDKIREPFSLVVFDHHPDMQPTLFEDMLSCGSWVKDVLETNSFLHKVFIVGAAEPLVEAMTTGYGDKVKCYSETDLSHEEGWNRFSEEHVDCPVYISVDKDVLNGASAATNWDQGSLTLEELESLLGIILKKEAVVGVDICGECSRSLNFFEEKRELAINGKANSELLALFLKSAESHGCRKHVTFMSRK